MGTPKAKYRPVLTAESIKHIIDLARKDALSTTPINETESLLLISVLSPFAAKIDNAAITEAYTTKPRKTLEESLGFDSLVPSVQNSYILDGVAYQTKEEYWEACYVKSTTSPGNLSMTVKEIQAAKEHKYLNGLMTKEEMVAFENGL